MEQLNATYLSITGHLVQTLGISAIALLFFMLYRTAPVRYFRYWVAAWLVLLVSMLSLHLSFRLHALHLLEFFYFLGEYLFALLLWVGLSVYPRNKRQIFFRWSWVFLIFSTWSLFLTLLQLPFGDRFTLHSLIFSFSLLPSWWALRILPLPRKHRHIKIFTLGALSLLILVFIANGLSLGSAPWWSTSTTMIYNAYQSIIDMMIEMFLAVGLLSIAAANMQAQLERTNRKLESERDRLSMLAHRDALTNCFNRRALMELQTRIRDREGLLIMIDINHLKKINDELGHQAGDAVILRVANTLKNCMREHDYIFRYGGDEFLLVAFDFPLNEAHDKIKRVNELLASEHKGPKGYTTSIAWGLQNFDSKLSLKEAINLADKAMYENKMQSR